MTYTLGVLDVDTIFASVTSFVTGSLLPVVTGMIVLSVSIALGIKTVRKFAHKLI